MRFFDELKTRNFGIYGQWTAIVSMLLCFGLGLANVLTFSWIIFFGAFALLSSVCIIVVELGWISRHIDGFRHINNYTRRALFYFILSLVQWLSLIIKPTALVVAAFFLLLTSFWYTLASFKGQEFMSSSILGGPGLAAAAARAL